MSMVSAESAVNLQLGRAALTPRQRWAIVVGHLIQKIRRISPTPVKLAILNWHRPFVGDALCIAKLNGFRIIVSPLDYCGCVLYYHGEYERYQTRAFKNLIEQTRPDVFLDVGANIGYYSLLAASSGVPNVVALEPSPEISSMLRESAALNSRLSPRIKIIQMAASDHEGEVSFWANDKSKNNFGLGSILQGMDQGGKSISVRCARLDTMLDDLPPGKLLCKMDVEGAEQLALDGMNRLVAERRPAFLLEVHPVELAKHGQSAAGVLESLRKKSYQLSVMRDGRESPLSPKDAIPEDTFCVIARPG
jgi:FkbM family methyltransferase